MTIYIQGQTNTMSCISIKVQAQKENLRSPNLMNSFTNIYSSCKGVIKQKKVEVLPDRSHKLNASYFRFFQGHKIPQ